tara:strand:+ start:5379 stop:5852 length:474 start_codon:yes stop_codon:yes gene_type:complete
MTIQHVHLPLGTFKSLEVLINALKKAHVPIEAGAHMLLTNFDFKLETEERAATIAIGPLSDFGVQEDVTLFECFRKLGEKNYKPCPPEVGPLLALKRDLPLDVNSFAVGMEPFLAPTDTEDIFYVKYNGVYRTLSSMQVGGETFFTPAETIAMIAPS